jgi:retron-type reverse transcriptase
MFEDIISLQNLCAAWREFLPGKKLKKDVAEFSLNLSSNLFALHEDLENKTYRHGGYKVFGISDPKPRVIHKASVRDRVLHHAIYRILYPYFDRKFIDDAYSCRDEKGTHRAVRRFEQFARRVSKNNTRTAWVLKCDIRKFFASIDQEVLFRILSKHIPDRDILWMLHEVVGSFKTMPGRGLPLGNLTSQLLVNVYMNEFDKYVKYELRQKYYVRYADDFAFFSAEKNELEKLIPAIADFLEKKLKLSLHPDKVYIKSWASGVDFLGWVNLPDYKVLRTATKKRMFKRIAQNPKESTISSYLGMLRHGNARKLAELIAKGKTKRL